MLNVTQIARVCHEATRHYNEEVHLDPLLPWSYVPAWQKASVIDGVMYVMNYPMTTPAECHENWMKHKLAGGWVYGPEKDAARKTHPCLVPYKELPEAWRAKDVLFVNVVRALMPPPRFAAIGLADALLAAPAEATEMLQKVIDEAADTTQEANLALLGATEETDGKEHAEDKPGDLAAQADGDGAEAAGVEGEGTSKEGRLS